MWVGRVLMGHTYWHIILVVALSYRINVYGKGSPTMKIYPTTSIHGQPPNKGQKPPLQKCPLLGVSTVLAYIALTSWTVSSPISWSRHHLRPKRWRDHFCSTIWHWRHCRGPWWWSYRLCGGMLDSPTLGWSRPPNRKQKPTMQSVDEKQETRLVLMMKYLYVRTIVEQVGWRKNCLVNRTIESGYSGN